MFCLHNSNMDIKINNAIGICYLLTLFLSRSSFFSFRTSTPLSKNTNNRGLEFAELEAENGVNLISKGSTSDIELSPQSSFVRKIQHKIAERSNLKSHSVGRGLSRRVTIYRE